MDISVTVLPCARSGWLTQQDAVLPQCLVPLETDSLVDAIRRILPSSLTCYANQSVPVHVCLPERDKRPVWRVLFVMPVLEDVVPEGWIAHRELETLSSARNRVDGALLCSAIEGRHGNPLLLEDGRVAGLPVASGQSDFSDNEILRLDHTRTEGETGFLLEVLQPERTETLAALGCGEGRHMIQLASKGFTNQIGIDLDPLSLSRARRRLDERGLQACRLIEGDFTNVDYHCDHAYAYFGAFACGRNRDVRGDLLAISRRLRTGGRLFIDLINRNFFSEETPLNRWMFDGENIVVESARLDPSTDHLVTERIYAALSRNSCVRYRYDQKAFTRDRILSLVREAGFTDLCIRSREDGLPCSDDRQRLLVVLRKDAPAASVTSRA